MSDDFDDLARDAPADFLLEPEEKPEQPEQQDWRDDPGWRIVSYNPELWSEADAPNRPTAKAELANPPIWASAYEDGHLVATWWRPRVVIPRPDPSSDHSATVVA